MKIVALSDVCDIVNGGTPKSKVAEFWGGDVQWLTPAQMGKLDSPLISDTDRTITAKGLAKCSAKLVPSRSVILSTRAPIGHLAINEVPMAFNQGCRGLVPGDRLDASYLYYYLWRSRADLDALGSGTTFKELSASRLKEFPIPLPPMPEQLQIVAALNEAFAGIASASSNAEKNLKNARDLYAIQLEDALSEGFETTELKNLASFENGDRGENYVGRNDYVSKGIPILSAGHLSASGIDTQAMNFIPRDRFDLLRSGKIRRGDILFCLRGSLGKFAYNDVYEEGAIGSSLIIVRPNERLDPQYLCLYFASDQCAKMIRHFENGAAQPNLGGKSLEKFLVPIPPRETQSAIVARLAATRKSVEALTSIYEKRLLELEQLKQSILDNAFLGKLTRTEQAVAA